MCNEKYAEGDRGEAFVGPRLVLSVHSGERDGFLRIGLEATNSGEEREDGEYAETGSETNKSWPNALLSHRYPSARCGARDRHQCESKIASVGQRGAGMVGGRGRGSGAQITKYRKVYDL